MLILVADTFTQGPFKDVYYLGLAFTCSDVGKTDSASTGDGATDNGSVCDGIFNNDQYDDMEVKSDGNVKAAQNVNVKHKAGNVKTSSK